MIFRLIWLAVTIFAIGLFVLGLPARHAQLQVISPAANIRVGELLPEEAQALVDLGLSPRFYASYFTALEAITAIPFILVAILLFWRKAEEWVVFLISITGVLTGTMALPVVAALVASLPEWEMPVLILRNIAIMGLITQFFVFPDGRFVPGWTRWAAPLWVVYSFAATFLPSLAPPVGLAGVGPQDLPIMLWLFLWMGLGGYAQIFRFRYVSTPIQRQQTKYAVWGLVIAFATAFLAFLVNYLGRVFIPTPLISMQLKLLSLTITLLVALPALPLSVALSVLRYRLWDIDLLIRRTLVYGVLTASLALFYFGLILLLEGMLRSLVGSSGQVATVISTLVIAALFSPLRRRIQDFIDRRFFRQKYDAELALAEFAAAARNETNLNQLSTYLTATVQKTLQPEMVSLWLKPGEERK
ncbi:MAG: hypothetical protein R6V73_03705 [Anaerolineales bacterium]|jgi:hypothetical protein